MKKTLGLFCNDQGFKNNQRPMSQIKNVLPEILLVYIRQSALQNRKVAADIQKQHLPVSTSRNSSVLRKKPFLWNEKYKHAPFLKEKP